jgi:hypothetical protein
VAHEKNSATCGCGNKVPAKSIWRALESGKKLSCSVCGARGEPTVVVDALVVFVNDESGEAGCRYCGCPEFHDGEPCPTAIRAGLVSAEVE